MKAIQYLIYINTLFISVALSYSALADRLTLEMNDRLYTGSAQIIGIRQEIQRQHRHFDLQRSQLASVVVYAKSEFGNGTIALTINQREHDRKRVDGDPRKFRNHGIRTYDVIQLSPLHQQTPGAWQLRLDGHIKVLKIVAHVNPLRRPSPVQFQLVGTSKVPKVVEETESFSFHHDFVSVLSLKGSSNLVKVTRVLIEYRNGTADRLVELEGNLHEGERKTVRVSRNNIYKIWITATSPSLFGSRGEYAVEVGVRRR
ncbi:MAG: hypothetical protein KDD61_08455 [Bdellovibrionales bacterium]|nr:hypothetical protein [Bdellovibrionales bacterium]